MFEVKQIGKGNISGQLKINKILYECGKDMVKRYNLHHWDNSKLKNCIIMALCELKNSVFLVTENGKPVATFQVRLDRSSLYFEKLACLPSCSRKGVGSYCIKYIEEMAKKEKCKKVCMDVYSESFHALEFYLHRGYTVCGETISLKYKEVKMEKVLQ